jgi:hypothetical protein
VKLMRQRQTNDREENIDNSTVVDKDKVGLELQPGSQLFVGSTLPEVSID